MTFRVRLSTNTVVDSGVRDLERERDETEREREREGDRERDTERERGDADLERETERERERECEREGDLERLELIALYTQRCSLKEGGCKVRNELQRTGTPPLQRNWFSPGHERDKQQRSTQKLEV